VLPQLHFEGRVMLRFDCLVLAAGLLAAAAPAAAGVAVGVQGGVGFASLSGDVPANTSYARQAGAIAGGVFEFDITHDVRVSLQPRYARRGTQLRVATEDDTQRDSTTVEMDYVSVPILAKIKAGRTYVTSGVDLGFPTQVTLRDTGGETDASDLVADFDLGVEFGFGVEFALQRSIVNVELRYVQSLLDLADFESSTATGSLPVRFRSTAFELLVGVMLPFGGSR